ncbi:MAG: DUF4982 domain-containing protein [Clostridia bacterium]|nr:DUF4982 domain-containing protein [Clostridia bacterium]
MYLKTNFKFKKFELDTIDESVFAPDFDDSAWRTVRIPHDWAVEGDFLAENDPTVNQIVEDGMKKAQIITGWTGGLPTVGAGVYRKWVKLPKTDKVFLEFDGVMWNSRIYINGKLAGQNHFGYKSFSVDITDFVNFGEENLIAVYAEVRENSGRWYSGAGIYRNIRLVSKPEAHIAYNGIWVRQSYLDDNMAIMDISAELVNTSGFTAKITAPDGQQFELVTKGDAVLFELEKPILWDVTSPKLYTAEITLENGYSESVKFGIRKCEFTRQGFFLNGRYLKMKGVCMHHDLGAIGAAFNKSALKRQIEIMKGMGVNAWRTSHNPPAPELLQLCDEMGILVMDEFFDEWRLAKVKNGYSQTFDEHAKQDVIDIIKRDRNHPCVIMWSIGNEIREQWWEDGWLTGKMLYDITKATDPTRPVTACFNGYPQCFTNHLAFYTDIVGLNYKPHTYETNYNKYTDKMLLGSETESCISSRGIYHFPAEICIDKKKWDDLAVSDYGLVAPPWAYYAERELAYQQDNPFVMGEFIWTGFDYLGEPTPYYSEWPSRSSYFGVVDLAGLPKNRYYLYRSVWTDIPTLHIFPHWNWENKIGENVPVHVYTNFDEVELFVNGVSQGKRTFAKKKTEFADRQDEWRNQLERFRLMWDDVVYQPGEITAVAYKNGKEAMRKTIKTAGAPHSIRLSAYSQSIAADGEDINYITAEIVDKEGNLCPNADNRITFTATGAEVYATDAGDQRETETFLRSDKKAMSGMLVAVIRSTETAGEVTVTATADGLKSGTVSFRCE